MHIVPTCRLCPLVDLLSTAKAVWSEKNRTAGASGTGTGLLSSSRTALRPFGTAYSGWQLPMHGSGGQILFCGGILLVSRQTSSGAG